MRYINTRTGAVIDSPDVLFGDEWIKEEIQKDIMQQKDIKDIQESEKQDESDVVDDITKNDIMQELDAMGIKYNPRSNKSELYDLMMRGK